LSAVASRTRGETVVIALGRERFAYRDFTIAPTKA